MAVFRVEKTRDYTVMANHHLRNTELSLKAKGLLSLMLSLPEEWDYTTKGLARICKDGVDSICAGVRELEDHGYVVRERIRNPNGQLGAIEYTILEQPRTSEPKRENPVQANPALDYPVLGKPEQENPAQLNTYRTNKDESNTLSANPYSIKSYPINPIADQMGMDGMDVYREIIKGNIEYDIMKNNFPYDHERLDEIVELMAETLASRKSTFCIAGDTYPASTVKFKLLRINSLHIQYVFECLDKNTTHIDISTVLGNLDTTLAAMELGPLFGLWFQSLFVGLTMSALTVCIFVVIYGRMIEIYLVTSIAPIPMATMVNREWGNMGQNYLRSLLALAFQAFLIIVCVGIYAVLVKNITTGTDIMNAIWTCMGYTVLLCFTLFKTGSLAKSIFNAH